MNRIIKVKISDDIFLHNKFYCLLETVAMKDNEKIPLRFLSNIKRTKMIP